MCQSDSSISRLQSADHAFMNQDSLRSSTHLSDCSPKLPQSIDESIAQIKAFALREFDREVVRKQLYYHTRDHLDNVRRRSTQISQAVFPFLERRSRPALDLSRTELLLDLCVAAHDMIQIFVDQPDRSASRRRESGVSERATLDRLLDYTHAVNQPLRNHDPNSSAIVTDEDIAIIQAAIESTICTYDPTEQAIYQADLYKSQPPVSIVARILSLADIGALGIDGIDSYNQEGSLLFLEENLDVIPYLLDGTLDRLRSDDPLYQNLQQRLLKRSRFQVSFAKSRVARLKSEFAGLPEAACSTLVHDVFRHLTPATVDTIAATTPTAETTPLPSLLRFFELERYLDRASDQFSDSASSI